MRSGTLKPNLLLIFMDDMTHRAIGGFNNPEVQTPHIDRLMRRGTLFTHAHNQGAWSGAVCIPSRAMLITGLSLWHARERIEHTPLLGEWLGQYGYETHFVGKWHNSEAALRRSYQHVGPHGGGFFPSTPETGDAYNRPAPGNSWRPDDPTRDGHWLRVENRIVHTSERWANAALDVLRDAKGNEKPFFLHVAFHAPHDPRQAPTEFLDRYPLSRISVPPNFLPEHPFDNGDLRVRDEKLAPFPRTPDAVQVHRREYYAILTHADHHIGRILEAVPENTLVVFSSDHGLAVGEHGLMGKQNCYDHSVRVPLIFAGPGVPENKKSDALVYQNQIFATICELAGIPAPATLENPSLAPLVRGGRQRPDAAVFGAYLDVQRMVRTRTHKLIVYPKANQVQLFDLRADPWETRNIAGENPERVKQLWGRLNRLQKSLDDPLPLPMPSGPANASR